ncbi:methyltransferase [Tyzzerella sp. An114]|uniref:O-methyltransferase n=1 Tax=Tyzzerella sp. An114 TaxID=1965545 RepID=UPI000B434F26|nr:O-methyltransferase [Tyzzerella sp. An114]OUQ60040.1 methyltransferase [Tyzzerella sp. An114]
MNYVTDDYLNMYLRTVQPKYKGTLGEIQEEATEANVPIIPHETARFLSVLLTLKKPKHILEIGTAVGFSSSLMAQYIPEDGTITTIDRFEVMLKDARVNIERMGLTDTIKILEGDAADILPTLEGPYDVIFMDAAKGQYGNFLPHCIRLLPVGGMLIVDDVLQGGDIAQSRFEVPRRQRTIHKRMRNFLWDISHSDLLESSIIPIGDGVALCVKIKEGQWIKEGEEENDD